MSVSKDPNEREGVIQASRLLVIAARTAPKSGGKDDILTSILNEKEKEAVAAEMEKISKERAIDWIERDAGNVRASELIMLVGVRGTKHFGLDCGACGYPSCDVFEKALKKAGDDFTGPTCLFKALDLGIALGSAVKTASILNIDNRIMYSIGAAARRLNLMPDATIIMGIPLSVKGKNIYVDRKWSKR
jgi:uncharacterized ferredoxin-like protein